MRGHVIIEENNFCFELHWKLLSKVVLLQRFDNRLYVAYLPNFEFFIKTITSKTDLRGFSQFLIISPKSPSIKSVAKTTALPAAKYDRNRKIHSEPGSLDSEQC